MAGKVQIYTAKMGEKEIYTDLWVSVDKQSFLASQLLQRLNTQFQVHFRWKNSAKIIGRDKVKLLIRILRHL